MRAMMWVLVCLALLYGEAGSERVTSRRSFPPYSKWRTQHGQRQPYFASQDYQPDTPALPSGGAFDQGYGGGRHAPARSLRDLRRRTSRRDDTATVFTTLSNPSMLEMGRDANSWPIPVDASMRLAQQDGANGGYAPPPMMGGRPPSAAAAAAPSFLEEQDTDPENQAVQEIVRQAGGAADPGVSDEDVSASPFFQFKQVNPEATRDVMEDPFGGEAVMGQPVMPSHRVVRSMSPGRFEAPPLGDIMAELSSVPPKPHGAAPRPHPFMSQSVDFPSVLPPANAPAPPREHLPGVHVIADSIPPPSLLSLTEVSHPISGDPVAIHPAAAPAAAAAPPVAARSQPQASAAQERDPDAPPAFAPPPPGPAGSGSSMLEMGTTVRHKTTAADHGATPQQVIHRMAHPELYRKAPTEPVRVLVPPPLMLRSEASQAEEDDRSFRIW